MFVRPSYDSWKPRRNSISRSSWKTNLLVVPYTIRKKSACEIFEFIYYRSWNVQLNYNLNNKIYLLNLIIEKQTNNNFIIPCEINILIIKLYSVLIDETLCSITWETLGSRLCCRFPWHPLHSAPSTLRMWTSCTLMASFHSLWQHLFWGNINMPRKTFQLVWRQAPDALCFCKHRCSLPASIIRYASKL